MSWVGDSSVLIFLPLPPVLIFLPLWVGVCGPMGDGWFPVGLSPTLYMHTLMHVGVVDLAHTYLSCSKIGVYVTAVSPSTRGVSQMSKVRIESQRGEATPSWCDSVHHRSVGGIRG